MLTILEHKSSSYGPRTFHNATTADLTIAVAVNYHTGGEKLTHKAAGDNFLALPYHDALLTNARKLFIDCRRRNVKILNVAGNGIYTYHTAGVNQAQVNQYLFDILSLVHQHSPLEKVISGGQTGADIAGIVAAYRLGIPAEAMFPKGFIQRHEDKIDRTHTHDEIVAQVLEGSQALVTKTTGL